MKAHTRQARRSNQEAPFRHWKRGHCIAGRFIASAMPGTTKAPHFLATVMSCVSRRGAHRVIRLATRVWVGDARRTQTLHNVGALR